jgi:hypothetical protein
MTCHLLNSESILSFHAEMVLRNWPNRLGSQAGGSPEELGRSSGRVYLPSSHDTDRLSVGRMV